jgi:hypothetical protein
MSDAKQRPPELLVDERWDKAVDLTLRRFVYSGAVGCLSALLLFREYGSFAPVANMHLPLLRQFCGTRLLCASYFTEKHIVHLHSMINCDYQLEDQVGVTV